MMEIIIDDKTKNKAKNAFNNNMSTDTKLSKSRGKRVLILSDATCYKVGY